MRDHPIPPVTELLQYRAIGVVRGRYLPEAPECFSRGLIVDENGEEIEAVVLGRAISLIKRRLKADAPHLWVVYPRCRDEEHLHLQISGIWEPSTLTNVSNTKKTNKKADENEDKLIESVSDQVKEGDDYFSIRGELIYTKPETKDLVLRIRQKPKKNGKKTFPFKLHLKGELSLDFLRHFVSLDVRRMGQKLYLEDNEVIGPVKAKK
ncbi:MULTISPECIES: hypothetical protein [Prochlorococcus]|uniref:Uncharacterized protein n=1 Tax=Prochlorococcus marinus (strain SARG / CCMP1375 / SS120) TaxID=167539 RepID=Q7VD98_PROMA|nr:MULTISPECIES: hypothetical protein [Prochlorococcus]AAP99530.1 Uncharacterized protein Pro_0485 [Prochlorococcus marinus subsp. marinus str. CCMP1375]KGG11197.1 hypothetical protein EV04_1272 [Prochlorococcus marinus str. LG]KGG21535.1 hypothetical protein EV08_0622 [Prochlorococcus marinus str. SS2]KGG23121.1 hypothetical protein EV09_1867 [Prochlorococcus marinus str. SS35]KGG33831.1 hypothetical protein EV10_0268 [Prochlorococcus marinus str. SS51]